VHDPDDARAATGVPCVGVVPLGSPADDPATDEAVRRIRDQLAANLDARPTTVALVAAVAGRSGADVADALAMAVARSGRRTVALGTRPGDDLAATLRGERRLVDAVEATPIAQLDVVAGDLSAPDTRDLAAGPSMRRAVDDLRTAAEVVVLYAGDTVGGSTALAVAPVADVALVVAEQGATRADDLSRMVVDLQGCDLEVAGVVLVDRTAPASAGASRLSARGPTYSRS
jgi:MinD-like ATPase involved in chromosome partitioning or flagellar assembly